MSDIKSTFFEPYEMIKAFILNIKNNPDVDQVIKNTVIFEKTRITELYVNLSESDKILFIDRSRNLYNELSIRSYYQTLCSWLIEDILKTIIIDEIPFIQNRDLIKLFLENLSIIVELIKNDNITLYLCASSWDSRILPNELEDLVNRRISYDDYVKESHFYGINAPDYVFDSLEKPDHYFVIAENDYDLGLYIDQVFKNTFDIFSAWHEINLKMKDFIQDFYKYDTKKLTSKEKNLKSFQCKLSKRQIEILCQAVNKVYLFKQRINSKALIEVFNCKLYEPLQVNNNRLLTYLFSRLDDNSFIDREWQSIIEKHKLFLSSKGKFLLSGDLATAKKHYTDMGNPKGFEEIDKAILEIKKLKD